MSVCRVLFLILKIIQKINEIELAFLKLANFDLAIDDISEEAVTDEDNPTAVCPQFSNP